MMDHDPPGGGRSGDAALSARFQPIFDRIGAGTVEREQTRDLAFDAVGALRDAGFGALRIPRGEGGGGVSLSQLFRLLVALAAADSNLPQILRAHFAFVEGRLNVRDRPQPDPWFERIVDGALIGAAMAERTEGTETTVTLTRGDDGWILDGRKYYSTGTIYATWIAAVAKDGDDRVTVVLPANSPGIRIEDDWDGFGQRMTGSGTTHFDKVAVGDEHIVRRFPLREFPADTYLVAFYQLFHLATLAGIGRAALRDAIAFVQPRTRTFGVPGSSVPRKDPLVQRVIGRLASLAFAAESLVDNVAAATEGAHEAWRAGEDDAALYAEVDIKAFQAQQVVIDLVLQAATLLFEVGGASATSETLRLDRHWRNARVLASHNPAIQRERAIGDYHLNGALPSAAWSAGFGKASGGGDA
jgi:alkylation response protein AidB-like acyl-CoA dehydrogenase